MHEGALNAIQVKDPSSPQAYSLISYTDDEETDKDIVFNMIQTQNQNCPFLLAPLLINGLRVKAGVDSMATHSFISPSLAKALKIRIVPTKGTMQLGAQGQTAPRVGCTEALKLKCGLRETHHKFEVLELGTEGINCILGLDSFQKLNFEVQGIPHEFPKEVHETPQDEEVYINKPSQQYLIFQESFEKFCKSRIEKNESITGFCNLPEATVPINIQEKVLRSTVNNTKSTIGKERSSLSR